MIFALCIGLTMVVVIFSGRFFVSTEFWLYPYLISKKLTPYINIADQHFPGILFGPLSFSTFGIDSLSKAMFMQAILLIVLCIFSYLWFANRFVHNKQAIVLTTIFAMGYYLLDGNHLWLEQWSLLSIIVAMVASSSRGSQNYLSGFLLAFALINRPFAIGWVLVAFMISSEKRKLIVGGLSYFALIILWFWKNQNFEELLHLIYFSKTVYLDMAAKMPSKRESAQLLLVVVPIIYMMRRQPVLWIAMVVGLFCAWPRFEYYHAVFVLFGLFFVKKLRHWEIFGVSCLFGAMVLIKALPISSDNFYNAGQAQGFSKELTRYSIDSVYLFGGPDQAYVMADKIPAGDYYLPSLSWYHQDELLVDNQIKALESETGELIVINRNSVVDGVNLIDSSPRLYNYILKHYKKEGTWETYDFYFESQIVENKK